MKISGSRRLIKALSERAELNDVKNVVRLNTSEMQRKAQRNAPVDTGAMKRYIMISSFDDGLTGRVGSLMNYSSYVEYGTRFSSAQPFIRPAFREQKRIFIKDLKRLMK